MSEASTHTDGVADDAFCSLSAYFAAYRKNVVLMTDAMFFYTINYNFNAMKKRHLTLLLLTGILFLGQMVHAKDLFSNLDKATEKKYWDFMSERLFDPKIRVFAKFPYKDIRIALSDATLKDSLIVKNLVLELGPVIQNKKILIEPYRQGERLPDLWLHFPKRDTLNRSTHNFSFSSNGELKKFEDESGNIIKYDGFKGQFQTEIYLQNILFDFKDAATDSLRTRYIRYAILRSFCAFNGNRNTIKTYIDHAVFNAYEFNPEGTEFKEVDKFLLFKLYLQDVNKQYKNYFLEYHSWMEYYIYFINEFLSGFSYKIITFIIGLILFLVFLKSVFIRSYKSTIMSYILPGLTIFAILYLTMVLNEIPLIFTFGKENYNDFRHVTRLSGYLVNNFIVLIISISFFTCTLYIIENYLLPLKAFRKRKVLFQALTLPFLIVTTILSLILLTGTHIHLAGLLAKVLTWGITFSVARGIWLFLNNISDLKLKEKEVEISRLKEQKSQAELQALHSRINPHFLYNSLNTIAGLAHSNPDKTEQMALSLSDLFRYTINRNGEQMSSVKEEMMMVETYLDIEKIRFGQRMTFTIDVDQDLKELLIPKYIIQPLVENAVKHGISKINGAGNIGISVRSDKDDLLIEIFDNGPAFDEGLVSGYGLQSVFDILELTYASRASMHWENEPRKFIQITIPLK
ncbi:sensor histidine kinase [Saccharicrinis sp. FJH62]|uniref:sensor histidine kinase n=1 Tax=Saccharicrinis sp. FJH62 TaxID=3344657 RepID=UPI0035D49B9E